MQPYGPLDNYILSHRNQSGLSQEDLAVLLAVKRQRIGKYEDQSLLPDVRRAIALALIFDEPTELLFAGVSDRMRQQIAARARVLLQEMTDDPTSENLRKLETLTRLRHIADDDLTLWRDDS